MSPLTELIGSAKAYGWGSFAAAGDYESIATVTVGSGGVSEINFNSIPSTYNHLQLRGIYRDTWSVTGFGEFYLYPNNSTSALYADHWLQGNGATASATGLANRSDGMFLGQGVRNGSAANSFGGFVVDILDYKDTNKFKTARALSGVDLNGSGIVLLQSALWRSTDAITSFKLTPNGVGFAQYSSFALYGIKGA